MKSLLLVSALSLLPLTSMGADAPKAVNPATGAFTATNQKGSTASGSPVFTDTAGRTLTSPAPSTSATKTPAPPQLNHSTVSSSAPGTSQLKTAGFTASNPSSKGVGGSGGAGGVGNPVDTAVGNAVYSAGDLKAPSAPK